MRNFLTNRSNDSGYDFFDDVFDSFFGVSPRVTCRNGMRADIKETDKGTELSVDMPGFDKKDIKLSLNDGYLTIEAERDEKEENKHYLRRERSYSCSRSFYVGDAITEEDIKAKYNNGTLVLDIPKKEKEIPPTKYIEIE